MQQARPITVSAATTTGPLLIHSLSTFGFALVTDHGIEELVLKAARLEASRFFALPLEEKLLCDIRRSANHRGYVPVDEAGAYGDEGERRYESYDVGLDLNPDHHDVAQGTPLMGPNVWPVDGRLRTAAQRCFDHLSGLADTLLAEVASALGLDVDLLQTKRTAPLNQMRLINYHEVARPSTHVAMGAHTDYEFLTLIWPDGPGLEVRTSEGTWAHIVAPEGSLVVLVGDLLEAASGGLLRSSLHRVDQGAGSRSSTVFFAGADFNAVITPMHQRGDIHSDSNSDRHSEIIDLRNGDDTEQAPVTYEIKAGPHLVTQLRRDFPYLRQHLPDADQDSWESDFEQRRMAGQ